MELGATVCFRQNPLCLTCPVRAFCAGSKRGEPESFPRLAPKQMEQRAVTRVWCERRGELLLHRAPAAARRFANMHELPTADHLRLDESTVARQPLLAKKRRGITRFQITESIHTAPPASAKQQHGPDLVWVPLAGIDAVTLSGPHRRWVREILAQRG